MEEKERPAVEVEKDRPKILLCLSGSVAVVKVPQLVVMLREFAQVKVVVTEASKHFVDRSRIYNPQAYAAYTALDPPTAVLDDAQEWGAWDAVGDPVLHIQLRDWADVMLVAPLSANTLGKLANGLCDNLLIHTKLERDLIEDIFLIEDSFPLHGTMMPDDHKNTCIARAWDFQNNKPFVVAPAMNTHMWQHPMTDRHLSILKELGVLVIPPASKLLACGDRGIGALAAVDDICNVAKDSCCFRPSR